MLDGKAKDEDANIELLKKLKAGDVFIITIPEQEKLQNYLGKQKEDVTFDAISKDTGISKERLLEINQEISIHFKNNLAPKVFYKSMLKTAQGNNTEFEMFFIRPDVDLCCLFMFKIIDIKQNMRHLNSPSYLFLRNNWEKYRGY